MSSPLEILRSDWSRWNSTGRTKLYISLGPVVLLPNGEGGDARLEQAQAEAPVGRDVCLVSKGYGKSLCLSIAALCDGLQAR